MVMQQDTKTSDPGTLPVVEFKNVGLRFDQNWIHQSLNLQLQSDRIIALIGDSGCGKTTLVREILMLEQIDEGEIFLRGENITAIASDSAKGRVIASKIGMMFQSGALFNNLTAIQNVMFPIREYTDFSSEVTCDIAAMKLKLTGLQTDAFDKYPAELSGGMLKRTALARALALDPSIIFLDEPSAGLDPYSASKFDDLIQQLQRALNLTIVIITHDIDTILTIADEVVYMGDKKILVHESTKQAIQRKTPENLYHFFHSNRGIQAQKRAGIQPIGDNDNEAVL
jgi:phospholipid/cholesterol/gamma-HCH transport system ATP-binding protein